MADYFEVQVAMVDHPKTVKLVRRAGEGAFRCLMRLWGFAAQSRHDGDLGGIDDEGLEAISRWTGEPGTFIRALVDAKWIDGEPGFRLLHDWGEHNGWVCNTNVRRNAAKAAAAELWKKKQKTRAPRMRDASGPHADRMPSACVAHEDLNSYHTDINTSFSEVEQQQQVNAYRMRDACAPHAEGNALPAFLPACLPGRAGRSDALQNPSMAGAAPPLRSAPPAPQQRGVGPEQEPEPAGGTAEAEPEIAPGEGWLPADLAAEMRAQLARRAPQPAPVDLEPADEPPQPAQDPAPAPAPELESGIAAAAPAPEPGQPVSIAALVAAALRPRGDS